ncbi:unnamed protein product [Calypogeia fissa]
MMATEGHSDAGFVVGQRVQSSTPEKNPEKKSSPQLGTIKYIGPVDGYEGLWIGVDWYSRQGRHNGTVNGRHYFETSEETSGSLVRPHSISGGVTLLEALVRRYCNSSAGALKGSEEDDMYVLSTSQRRITVELVGESQIEARQKQLQHLLVATLAYAGVSSPGPPGQFKSLVPNLKELDLTGNLLPDWPAVGKLRAELPKIEILNLSNSRLDIPKDRMMQTFNIKTLVLNNCNITWKQVEQLKVCLSCVEELHLCGNKITSIQFTTEQDSSSGLDCHVQGFDSLRLLNLENNHLANWEDIMKLSKLKRLEHLNLNSNSIHEVDYPGVPSTSKYSKEGVQDKDPSTSGHFLNLHCLLLGKNMISDWASLDALDKFPALQEVRLSENPITTTSKGGAQRYMLIARIQKITSLNGSEIKQRERRDAEIRYVRYALSSNNGGTLEELEKSHPRLAELRRFHDIPVESVHMGGTGLVSQKMSATLLSINILCVASSVGEKPPLNKRLPASTTVGKLKLICEGLFKLRAAKQRLYIKDQDPLPVLLDNDLESLSDLGIGADAVILVDEAADP